MELSMGLVYSLKVTAVELRLINAALRCNLNEDQKADALALSAALSEQRIKQTRHVLGEVDKLERNLEK